MLTLQMLLIIIICDIVLKWTVISMFFMIGVMPFNKEIPYMFSCVCPKCGRMCHYEVFYTGNCLSVFFIPLFKWGKQYYVRSSCCGTTYILEKSVGDAISKGENIIIQSSDLTEVNSYYTPIRRCSSCGYECTDDFDFCPKCGSKLD